jgi:hypothetical protein
MKPACVVAFLLLTLTTIASDVCACTIPVFRYALDRWETDKFELILPPDTAANPELSNLLRPLRANGTANLAITTAKDPSITSPQLRTARLGGQTIWSGDLNAATLSQILDSPARQQILSRILAGESVIWVIAHSDTPEDLAEAERIEKRLRFLEQVAALPIQDPNDPDSQLGPRPALLLKFTALRLNRNDPAEALLLKMLAGPSGDIDPTKTSFAAAIFGRGRVLGAWALDSLDDASLEEASMFLIGRCSCRVKDQNPGWDILMTTDWTQALAQASPKKDTPPTPEPPPPTKPQQSQASPVTVKTSAKPHLTAISTQIFINAEGLFMERSTPKPSGEYLTKTTQILSLWQLIAASALLISLTAFLLRPKR